MAYRIRHCKWESGERYCMMVDAETGMPPWWPTLYITTKLRNKGHSVATMEKALRSIGILLAFAETREMDLEERILTRRFLGMDEIDALCDATEYKVASNGGRSKRESVSRAHQYNRLSTIAHYLQWLSREVLRERRTRDDDQRIEELATAIQARRPKVDEEESVDDRALTETARDRLLEIIDHEHGENPFRERKARERNALIIQMLMHLGLRRGELLGVQVGDIDWHEQTLTIHRRADEPDDPRMRQPRTKTLARKLPVFPDLLVAIDRYIRGPRRHTRGANTHRYLLVTHHKGKHEGVPLSEQGFAKIFKVIQGCDPLLRAVHPHALRHDWNLRFSQAMDELPEKRQPSPSEQERMRSHHMGWSPGSESAKRYNRRFIERKAREAAQQMHAKATRPRRGTPSPG